MPQSGAVPAAPAAPQPAAPQQGTAPAAAAPQTPDAHWGQICQEACAIFRPVIALLNKVTGHFDTDGSLVIVNPGGDFIGKLIDERWPASEEEKEAEKKAEANRAVEDAERAKRNAEAFAKAAKAMEEQPFEP